MKKVVASTEAGQGGVAQKELRTFQPFFIEHDPPKVLTEGDQISLPVVLRNHSDKPQTLLAVNRGLQYLLTHKDRYACWYSTQATQNVIEAIIAAMPVGKTGLATTPHLS